MLSEFVVVLMRLRLGLLLEDVAERFVISPTTMSKIYTTLIKVISKAMTFFHGHLGSKLGL